MNENSKDHAIAAMLRSRREAKGLTQKQMAELAEINIRHYQQFESGGRSLATASFATTMAVIAALEIEPYRFIDSYINAYHPRKKSALGGGVNN